MAKVSVFVGLMLGIVLLVACPDSSSSSGGGDPAVVFSGYKISAGIGSALDDPLVIFPGELTDFQLVMHDPEKKIVSLFIPPSTPEVNVVATKDSTVTGDGDNGFVVIGLSDPDVNGDRYLDLKVNFVKDPKDDTVHSFDVEAHESMDAAKVSGAIAAPFYMRRAHLPSIAVVDISGIAVSQDLLNPTVVSQNVNRILRISSEDPDAWVSGFRIHADSTDFTLSGTGVSSPSAQVYLVDGVADLKIAHRPDSRGKDVTLVVPNDAKEVKLEIEVLNHKEETFAPPLESHYYISSKNHPSGIALLAEGQYLGGDSDNLLSPGANDLRVEMIDPSSDVAKVKITLSGSSGSSLSGTGVTGPGPYTLVPATTSGTRGANFTLNLAVGNVGDKLQVKVVLLDSSAAEFVPSVEQTFTLQQARAPSTPTLNWQDGDIAAGGSVALPVDHAYDFRIIISDPDRQVDAFTFTPSATTLKVTGSNVSGAKITGLSDPDTNGNREVDVTVAVDVAVTASTALSLDLEAMRDGGGKKFSPEVKSRFNFNAELPAPTLSVFSAGSELLSGDHAWGDSFVASKTYDLEIKVGDQHSQVGKVVFTFSKNGFSLGGTGVSGSGKSYTLSTLPAPDVTTHQRDVTITLSLDSSTVVPLDFTLFGVELQKPDGSSFSPEVKKSYAVQRDILRNWAEKTVGTGKVFVRTKGNVVFYANANIEAGVFDNASGTITWKGTNSPTVSGSPGFAAVAVASNGTVAAQGNRIFALTAGAATKVIPGTFGQDGSITWGSTITLATSVTSPNDAGYLDRGSTGVLVYAHDGGITTHLFTPPSDLPKVSQNNTYGFTWDVSISEQLILAGADNSKGLALIDFDPDTAALKTATSVVTSNSINVGTAVDAVILTQNLLLLATKDAGVVLGELDPATKTASWLRQYSTSTGIPFISDKFQSIELVEDKYVLGIIKDSGIYLGVLDRSSKTIQWKSEHLKGVRGVPADANYNRSSSDNVLIIGTEGGKVITAAIDK